MPRHKKYKRKRNGYKKKKFFKKRTKYYKKTKMGKSINSIVPHKMYAKLKLRTAYDISYTETSPTV